MKPAIGPSGRRWWSAMRRRLAAAFLIVASPAPAAPPVFPDVPTSGRLSFPRDHGAHPDFRTEWWYVTGWLKTADGDDVGFQVTFFRSRTATDEANPSRFAPRQLLFAHAAIADPKLGRLEHDERIARAGFGVAGASVDDADVSLQRWRFRRLPPAASGGAVPGTSAAASSDAPSADALHFATRVDADRFALDLDLRSSGPLLAQGADAARPGYSQKGPVERDASRYYSVPQLEVTGTIARGAGPHRRDVAVSGTAWLDREWSSAYLDPQASGWDWVGLNLDDGGALMAFRMRDRSGGKLWAGGARRFADGRVERFGPDDVTFSTLKRWTSPRSGATWPVQQRIEIGGPRDAPGATTATAAPSPFAIVVDPLMDDQELDSRGSTGTIYWEGAVRVRAADPAGRPIGRGYLEMTGYDRPLAF